MRLRYIKNVVTLKLDQDKCIGCGVCVEVCPHAVIAMENRKARILDVDLCMECGGCAKNCASQAISVRSGVGCAAAIINSKFNRTGECSCGDSSDGSCC